jgi:transposase-like protein
MRFRDWEKRAAPGSTPNNVIECPFCQSRNISTTGETTSSSTYWRCHACGEIWNPTRQTQPARYRGWQEPHSR